MQHRFHARVVTWLADVPIRVFLGYNGHALDYKLPLLRSDEIMSRECTRLLDLMNYSVAGVQSNIGLEQVLEVKLDASATW